MNRNLIIQPGSTVNRFAESANIMRNGYERSLLQENHERCYLCGMPMDNPNRHEIFGGAYRSKSKKLGLWITIHFEHHEMIHSHPKDFKWLKRKAEVIALDYYGWSVQDFIKEFGRSYIE